MTVQDRPRDASCILRHSLAACSAFRGESNDLMTGVKAARSFGFDYCDAGCVGAGQFPKNREGCRILAVPSAMLPVLRNVSSETRSRLPAMYYYFLALISQPPIDPGLGY
jgi:hypothetical protein